MNRKKVQTYELLAQCLITRDPLKGYSISRWCKPVTGCEFSAESSTTEEATLRDDTTRNFFRVGKTRFEVEEITKSGEAPGVVEEELSDMTQASSVEGPVDSTTEFISPISNTMAMEILDELPLIGSPVPDRPLSFILDFAGHGKEYIVHVLIARKGDREVQVWEKWYARRSVSSFWKKTLPALCLGLLILNALLFAIVVPSLLLRHEEVKEPERVVQEPIVENKSMPSSHGDPELDRSRSKIQVLQRQMDTVQAAVQSFRTFPTNRLYKPRMSLLDSSCTLEEKLSEFFSQQAVLESLEQNEVLPWIAIEWRGTGNAPEIDRIFLTNQDGKSFHDFLIGIRNANLLDNSEVNSGKL